jgi:2-keto-3-deoxy-6-phosphogluconate aldolase
MQENSDCANQPILPVVRGDDSDALYPLLMALYESGMIFKSCDTLPAGEFGSINQ